MSRFCPAFPKSLMATAVLASWATVAGAAEVTASPLPLVEVQAGAREEYRFRTTAAPDQAAQDLRLSLDVSGADRSGHFLGTATLGLFWNVRRDIEPGTTDAMGTVFDGRQPFFDVYQLSAEYRGAALLREARVGRQTAEHGRPATFDGASLLLRPVPALSLFAFGGRSAHFFEVGAHPWDDWMASVGAGYRPFSTLRVEVDYRLLLEVAQDRTLASTPVVAHSWGLSAWWRAHEAVWARLTLRGLDQKFAEASVSAHAFFAGPGLGVDGRVRLQPVTLSELDEQDNPFFLTLGPSLPHVRWSLDLSRVFPLTRGSWEAHLGWNGRQLLGGAESAFNRNSNRVFVMGAVRDVGLTGLTVQLSLERLTDSAIPLVGQGIFTVNGSAAYQRDRVRGELGAQYYRYQYDYYRDVEELADVRVVFAEVRVKLLSWLSVRGRYQLELFDRTRHTFSVSLAQATPGPG